MNPFLEGVISIGLAIVGLAVVATLVSKNAQTPAVISSAGNAFSSGIRAATGPVMGGGFSVPSMIGGGFGS